MEKAVVVKLEGEVAWVQMASNESCSGCGAKTVCRPDNQNTRSLAVQNDLGAQLHQQVEIAERNHITLKLSFMQFGLPLLALLGGAGLAAQFPAPFAAELWQALCGVSLMLLSGYVTYLWSLQVASQGPAFEITSILPDFSSGSPY